MLEGAFTTNHAMMLADVSALLYAVFVTIVVAMASYFLASHVNREIPAPILQLGFVKRYQSKLQDLSLSANRANGHAAQLMAKQYFLTLVLLACSVLLSLIFQVNLLMLTFVGLAGLLGLPMIRLKDQAVIHSQLMRRDLPFFTDFLTLALSAGMELGQALEKLVAEVKPSPLRDAFQSATVEMRLGISREDAFRNLIRKAKFPEMETFVNTLVLAMHQGNDLCETLSVMASTMQKRRFERAEEEAGKISVKMMIPLLVFVLPSTTLVLIGPMLIEWMQLQ